MVEKLVDAGFLRRVSERGAAGAAPAAPGAGAPLHLQRKSESESRPAVASLAAELAATEPDAAVGAEIVTLLADEAPAFLRGEKTGEEILFSPARLPLWIRYFSNANILYAINNTLGAETLTRVLPAGRRGPRDRRRLRERGRGGAPAPRARVSRWRFTELVPTFARRGERAARAAAAPRDASSRPRSST